MSEEEWMQWMWSKSAKEQATDNGYTTIKPKTLVFTLAT